jgi:hypothetical protein
MSTILVESVVFVVSVNSTGSRQAPASFHHPLEFVLGLSRKGRILKVKLEPV